VSEPVLAVAGLTGLLEGASGLRTVLHDAELSVGSGRSFALLGESGSGKTFLLQSVLGLHGGSPGVVAGSARVLGVDVFAGLASRVVYEPGPPLRVRKDERGWRRAVQRRLRGVLGRAVTVVPQDPSTALPPFATVGRLLERAVCLGQPGLGRPEARERALEWLDRVHMYGVGEAARRYPHELSGGMAQRVGLALALAPSPVLLAADEPTTGLDAILRVHMLDLLGEAVESYGATLFLITHDAEAARLLARDVAVLRAGRVVERGPAHIVLDPGALPKHPYTRYLIEAEGVLAGQREASGVTGAAASVARRDEVGGAGETGCPYRATCPDADPGCGEAVPPLAQVGPEHWVACRRARE